MSSPAPPHDTAPAATVSDRLPGATRTPRFCRMHAIPPPQPPQGLYDGLHEHDACGVAFVATLTGQASHDIVAKAITALRNLEHRGATGSAPASGDGAGILLGMPDAFLRAVVDFELPQANAYAA